MAMAASLAGTLGAQQQPPRRPRLSSGADTNDATAYFQFGLERLQRTPRDAAAAFYWAERLDPASPQILYARHIALLMTDGHRLVQYLHRDPQTLLSPAVRQIDSLYHRALMQEPFLQRGLEEPLLLQYLTRAIAQDDWVGREAPSVGDVARAMDTVLSEYQPLLRGVLSFGRGNAREALHYYGRAMRMRRVRQDVVHTERAMAFMQLRELDSAAQALSTALALLRAEDEAVQRSVYESKARLEFALARVYEEQRNWGSARETYQRALVEDLGYFPAHLRLGQLALRTGDTATALIEFERAVGVNENEYLSRAYLGVVLSRLGRRREAAAHLRRATELEPWAASAWILLGRELDALADTAGALRAYSRYAGQARRADPPLAVVRARIAELTPR